LPDWEGSANTWYVLSEFLVYADVRLYVGSRTEWDSLIGASIER
jgi:3-mercaptopyruvate sulfurtransferase SseA